MSTISVRRRLLRWWLEIHAGLHAHLLCTVEEYVRWKPIPQEHIHAFVQKFMFDHLLTSSRECFRGGNIDTARGPVQNVLRCNGIQPVGGMDVCTL